ncbi:hypothetical protein V6R21_23410 [Limibacter armeniacum]|uniref:hypothetical protein n=1 Tax=Limibacter armeniacum TaxID=466084 RepID=UPI002FE5FF3B
MTKKEAEKLVQAYLNANIKGYSIVSQYTIESKSCFAVSYQSDKYIKSKKFEDITIVHGPTIVSKNDGKLYHTGSGRFVEDSIESFEKYGDPYLEKDTSRVILSLIKNVKFDSLTLTSLLKKVTGKGMLESKQTLTDLINGGIVNFENDLTEDDFQQLEKYGFIVDYPWLD